MCRTQDDDSDADPIRNESEQSSEVNQLAKVLAKSAAKGEKPKKEQWLPLHIWAASFLVLLACR